MDLQNSYKIEFLNRKVGSKRNLYQMLSQTYVLPDYTSHACTVDYLLQYTKEIIPIYTCEIAGTEIFNPRYKTKNALELLELLEELLAKNGKSPTGMNALKLPDVKWLCMILHKEDPQDNLKIFRKDKTVPVSRNLNTKFIFINSQVT